MRFIVADAKLSSVENRWKRDTTPRKGKSQRGFKHLNIWVWKIGRERFGDSNVKPLGWTQLSKRDWRLHFIDKPLKFPLTEEPINWLLPSQRALNDKTLKYNFIFYYTRILNAHGTIRYGQRVLVRNCCIQISLMGIFNDGRRWKMSSKQCRRKFKSMIPSGKWKWRGQSELR